MLNLTPHVIVLIRPDGSEITIPPSGIIARVTTTEHAVGNRRVHNSAFPAVRREFGPVIGLPEGRVHCIVSALVLSAIESRPADYPHRTFYFAPNTGPTARRNEAGQVTGVYSLVSI